MSNTTEKNLHATLQELQKKIEILKGKKRELNNQKVVLEKQIGDLYAQPLNDRQIMQLMHSAVDARAASYKGRMLNSGYLEKQITFNNNPLSFDDFEQLQGRGRVLGRRSSPRIADLEFNLVLIETYGAGEKTWAYYFFGDLIKQKIEDLYRCKHGDSAIDALESAEDRKLAINALHIQAGKLDEEIEAIEIEIEAASAPVKNFMRAV